MTRNPYAALARISRDFLVIRKDAPRPTIIGEFAPIKMEETQIPTWAWIGGGVLLGAVLWLALRSSQRVRNHRALLTALALSGCRTRLEGDEIFIEAPPPAVWPDLSGGRDLGLPPDLVQPRDLTPSLCCSPPGCYLVDGDMRTDVTRMINCCADPDVTRCP